MNWKDLIKLLVHYRQVDVDFTLSKDGDSIYIPYNKGYLYLYKKSNKYKINVYLDKTQIDIESSEHLSSDSELIQKFYEIVNNVRANSARLLGSFRKLTYQETLERLEEFEVIKDNKIDYISLESLCEFLEINYIDYIKSINW